MNNKLGVSILVCSYNGTDRLEQTLSYIAAQDHNCYCELIVVDNASSDGTKEFCDNWWKLNGSVNIEYKSIVQSIPGKAFAQELGTKESKYPFVLICDDDNWLSSTYVQRAYNIMITNIDIGIAGGLAEPVFEDESNIPEWFSNKQAQAMYAVGNQGRLTEDIEDLSKGRAYVYGAGCIIRKSLNESLDKAGVNLLLSCRKGETLTSGGDNELCYLTTRLGYKVVSSPELIFKHFMPKSRMNLDYVKRMREGSAETWNTVFLYFSLIKNRNYSFKTLMSDQLTSIIKYFKWSLKVLMGRKKDFEFYYSYGFHRHRAVHSLKYIYSYSKDRKEVIENLNAIKVFLRNK